MASGRITDVQVNQLREKLKPLIGTQLSVLNLPVAALHAFEPSQVGTIVGTLMDACIPHLEDMPQVGLSKHGGILGEREGYPDYKHQSGLRLELKLLYVDNPNLPIKKPPTAREPSARLTQKVTVKNIQPDKDVLLIVAYRLDLKRGHESLVSPTIMDIGLFSMIEVVEARDHRLKTAGGAWFGNYETPVVISKIGIDKKRRGIPLEMAYGRKESEGKDYNEDTNFGKLKRIPHAGLKAFLKKHASIEAIHDSPGMFDGLEDEDTQDE